MELNLSRKKITVVFEGERYEVYSPSNAQVKEFSKSEEADLDKTVAMLSKLGLPEDVCWAMDLESMQKIIEALTPQKKSSPT